MVNPGTFQGSRGRFLLAQSDIYASAVADGRINDAVSDIQRRYLKRYPMSLPHDQEPTQEWLDQVKDDEPDPDPVEPDWESLDAESTKALQDERAREAELLKARKDAIKRRLHYIYSKNRDKSSSREKGNLDHVSALRARLTGVETKQPRKKTPYNVWGPKNRDRVDPIFIKRVKDLGADASQHAAIRSAVYKELFEELPAATKEHWAHIAEEEHHAAITALKQKKNQGISTAPEDRQQVITSISKVIEPVLDMLGAHTGWKFSLICGGPEPADAGRLNMVVIHSGVLPGTVKMDFGAAERDALKNQIIPAFGRFLKRGYTMAECRSRALPDDHSLISLNDMVLDEDSRLQLHSFDFDDEHRAASQAAAESQKGKRLFEGVTSQGKKPQSPTGTPSHQVKPTPGKGKRALRILPNSDGNPRNYRPLTPSPLSQTSVTANQLVKVPASTLKHGDGLDGADNPQMGDAAAVTDHTPATPSQAASPPDSIGTRPATPYAAPLVAPLLNGAGTPPDDAAAAHIFTPPLTMPTPPATPLQLGPGLLFQPFSPVPAVHGSGGARDIAPPARPSMPHTKSAIATPPQTPPVRFNTPNTAFDGTGADSDAEQSAIAAHSPEGSPPPSLPPSPISSRPPSPDPLTGANQQAVVEKPHNEHTASLLTKLGELGRESSRRPSGTATVPRPEDMERDDEDAPKGRKRRANNAASQTPVSTKRLKGALVPRSSSTKADPTPAQRAFEVEVPDGCPTYLSKGIGLLTREHLGLGWKQLVEAWLVFEEKARFGEGTMEKKLPAGGRPQEIADWIKNARKPNFTPKISNIDKYSSKYLSWWRGIQPEWRLGGAEDGLLREGGNWDAIACSGANGMLSALAALFFWGSECLKQGASLTQWHMAVEDACVAITAATSELA